MHADYVRAGHVRAGHVRAGHVRAGHVRAGHVRAPASQPLDLSTYLSVIQLGHHDLPDAAHRLAQRPFRQRPQGKQSQRRHGPTGSTCLTYGLVHCPCCDPIADQQHIGVFLRMRVDPHPLDLVRMFLDLGDQVAVEAFDFIRVLGQVAALIVR